MAGSEQHRSRRLLLATTLAVVLAVMPAGSQLLPDPAALARVPPELVGRLRADPFTYFRFVNRRWTARVCELFADVRDVPTIRLHGDAHVEQYATTHDAWGLVDFDDSARGPAYVDIVRYLGSIEFAVRERGWTARRDALWDRFLEGYQRGLTTPDYRPAEPEVARRVRAQAPPSRAAFLASAERQMQPMDAPGAQALVDGLAALQTLVQEQRPDLAPGYFRVVRAGWLRIGVGSAATRKVLIRAQGPTAGPEDDVVLEGKEVANLEGVSCLEGRASPPAIRVVDGTRQLGRVKYDILAVGPTPLAPAVADRAANPVDWWISSWDPTYREVRLSDLHSVDDLSAIVFDSGVQLGAGVGQDDVVRQQLLAAVKRLDGRLKRGTSSLVSETLAGWQALRATNGR